MPGRYLTLGVGKLYHDGGYGFGANSSEHPPGHGTPPLADPLSWSNTEEQYPQCNWTILPGPQAQDGPAVAECAGLPKFVNSYSPNAVQSNGAYLTPAGTGSCEGVPGAVNSSWPGRYSPGGPYCAEDVGMDGEGGDPDGGIHGRPPLLDIPVVHEARRKLRAAAANLRSSGQPFFLGVGIKRPHLKWRVPKGFVEQYYNPATFTPALPAAWHGMAS